MNYNQTLNRFHCLHYSVKDLLSNVGDTFTKEEVRLNHYSLA